MTSLSVFYTRFLKIIYNTITISNKKINKIKSVWWGREGELEVYGSCREIVIFDAAGSIIAGQHQSSKTFCTLYLY
jgi:hypothetical protein